MGPRGHMDVGRGGVAGAYIRDDVSDTSTTYERRVAREQREMEEFRQLEQAALETPPRPHPKQHDPPKPHSQRVHTNTRHFHRKSPLL